MLKSRPFMKGGPMTILTTPRLLLRPFEEGDAAELYDYARGGRPTPAWKTAGRSSGPCSRPTTCLRWRTGRAAG